MTRPRSIAIIAMCTDRDPITGRVHGDRIARVVTSCFTVNVSAKLRPRTRRITVYPYVTRVGCGAIIVVSTDRDPITGRVHGDRPAKIVSCCFAIDVCAELGPRTRRVFVDAHVTCVRSIAIVLICADRDPVTTRIHGNTSAKVVTSCFAIDVTTEL